MGALDESSFVSEPRPYLHLLMVGVGSVWLNWMITSTVRRRADFEGVKIVGQLCFLPSAGQSGNQHVISAKVRAARPVVVFSMLPQRMPYSGVADISWASYTDLKAKMGTGRCKSSCQSRSISQAKNASIVQIGPRRSTGGHWSRAHHSDFGRPVFAERSYFALPRASSFLQRTSHQIRNLTD